MRRFPGFLLIGWLLLTGARPAHGQTAPTRANGRAGGLKGEYFNGPNFERKVHTQVDRQIDFNWFGQSPAPGVQAEYFSVRWTGKLYAPVGGVYRFTATVDDGVRIWVGGKKVIDEWRKQDDTRFVGEVTLNAGRLYDLRVEYYNDWKGSVISVFWEPPTPKKSFLSFSSSASRTLIPAQYLFSEAPRTTPPKKLAPARPVAPVAITPVANKSVRTKPPAVAAKPPIVRAIPDRPATPPPAEVTAVRPLANLPKPPAVQSDTVSRSVPLVPTDLPGSVFFGQSEYVLLPESLADLDRLVRVLRTNTQLRLDISGHTDNVGDSRLNQTLSEFRAKVVANYLIQRGVAPNRLTVRGFGSAQPAATNATELERVRNRRVVIAVRPTEVN